MGFFSDDKGNKSMMRLLAFMGFFLGGIVALWSIYAGMEAGILSGCALAAGGEVMKSFQKKFEQ